MKVLSDVKSNVKAGFKHPVALVLYGMLFAAFLFPMISGWLGKVKAKGGVVANLIPTKFTRSA